MRKHDLITRISLGSDVAESEPNLTDYFIQTSTYRELVNDEKDLVLGVKGSGKSALSKILTSRPEVFSISELADVNVISLSNIQGSHIFSGISDSTSEGTFRRVWIACIISIIGNHIVDSYGEVAGVEELSRSLERYGLASPNTQPIGKWKSLLRVISRSTTEVSGGVDAAGPSIGGRLTYNPSAVGNNIEDDHSPGWIRDDFDYLDLIEQVYGVLEVIRRRVWVVLDRLDEAFNDRPALEVSALRGLLRAHLDLSASGPRMRTKIFLRNDVFDLITRDRGFLNLTHLRSCQIRWTRSQIEELVVRRIRSTGVWDEVNPDLESLQYLAQVSESITRLFPSSTKVSIEDKGHRSGFTWLLYKSRDATLEYNPRNIVTLLGEARNAAIDRTFNHPKEYSPKVGKLISIADMESGWSALSRRRIEDTLYAEYNTLRPVIENFRSGRQKFNSAILAKILHVEVGGDEFKAAARLLVYYGFIREFEPDNWSIAELYLPGLGIVHGYSNSPVYHDSQSSVDVALASARHFSTAGDYGSAFSVLASEPGKPAQNLCYLADVAFQSGVRAHLREARAILEKHGKSNTQVKSTVLARRIALALADEDPASAWILARSVNLNYIDLVSRGFIKCISRNVSIEISIWQKGVLFRPANTDQSLLFENSFGLMAAGRLLGTARQFYGAQVVDSIVVLEKADGLFLEWWPIQTSHHRDIRSIEDALWSFARGEDVHPNLQPYQIISASFVLEKFGATPEGLTEGVVSSLVDVLRSSPVDLRLSFEGWSKFSNVADEVNAVLATPIVGR